MNLQFITKRFSVYQRKSFSNNDTLNESRTNVANVLIWTTRNTIKYQFLHWRLDFYQRSKLNRERRIWCKVQNRECKCNCYWVETKFIYVIYVFIYTFITIKLNYYKTIWLKNTKRSKQVRFMCTKNKYISI